MPLVATASAALPVPRTCARRLSYRNALPVPPGPSTNEARRWAGLGCAGSRAATMVSKARRWSALSCGRSASARHSHTLDGPHPSLPTIISVLCSVGLCGALPRVSLPVLLAFPRPAGFCAAVTVRVPCLIQSNPGLSPPARLV